jgi:hypothetical protein
VVQPSYRSALEEVLAGRDEEILELGLEDAFELLFKQPLDGITLAPDGGKKLLFLIDALDESADRAGLAKVLGTMLNGLPPQVGFVVTSRPELDITTSLKAHTPVEIRCEQEENLKDLRLYLKGALAPLVHPPEDLSTIVDALADKAEGLFLYASDAVGEFKAKDSVTLNDIVALKRGLGSRWKQTMDRALQVCKPRLGA